MNSIIQTQLLKNISENNSLYEVKETLGKLEYKLDENGERIKICEINEIKWNLISLCGEDGACILSPEKEVLDEIKNNNLEVSFIPLVAIDEKTGTLREKIVKNYDELSKGYTFFKEEDILFAKVTPSMENGNCIITKDIKNKVGFASTELNTIRCKDNIYNKFIWQILRSEYFRNIAKRTMKGTGGLLRVPSSFFYEHKISIPKDKKYNNRLYLSYQLQQSIAANIEEKSYQIDKLIFYHETMIELKKNAIGSILDDEFSNKLKKHAILDKLIITKSEKNIDNAIELVYSVTNSKGIIPESESERVQTSSDDKSNYKIINQFEYAFNPSRINVGSIGMLKHDEQGVVSPIYNVFSINQLIINPLYLGFYFQSNKFKNDVKRFVLNSVRPKLELDDLKRFELYFVYDENEEINKTIQLQKIEELNTKIENEKKHIKLHEGCITLLQMKKEKILYIG